MSSDLRDLIRDDLDRIPLPPDERWTMPRAGRGGFMSVGVAVIVVALVAIASLGGGQALQALRDRIESDRAAGGVVVPGDDYVYVSDGGPTSLGGNPTQAVQTIAMPAGQSIGPIGGNTYVGTAYDGGLMSVQGDRAYLPVATSTGSGPDEYETYLQEIDLPRGIALRRISTGIASIPRALQVELPGTPVFPAATAVSSDGTSVWLVRDSGDHGRVTVVDRFDGRTLSPLAHVVLSSSGPGAVRSRVVALGPDRLAVVRQHFESLNVTASDWYFLDAQLRIVASYTDDIGHRLPAGGECSTDVQASPTNTEWLVLCSDSSLFGDGALLFLDSSDFTIKVTVGLPRESGFAVGMTTATDGTVYVLTSRPVVTRVDPRTHRTIDARPVVQARSWLDHLLPLVTAAKGPGGPSVAFSPDGRYAYLAGASDQWWGSLATIDMREAKVVAHTSAYGAIGAVAVSPGGERLYALATDGGGVRRILLLAPDTLRSAGQSAPIGGDPFGIFAVRGHTAAAAVIATKPIGYVPSTACTVITFARASDGASARWTFTCRGGPMTWEAWREGLRRTAVDQGWRETASQPEVLDFVKDDLGVAMTIEARPSDGAFALTQRAVRSSEAIRAVLESPTGTMFAQFPKAIGSQACEIRGGGPPPGIVVAGTCRTEAEAIGSNYIVRFIYIWDARQFHLAGEPSSGELQHAWSFTVDAAGAVVPQPDSGNFPPQYAK